MASTRPIRKEPPNIVRTGLSPATKPLPVRSMIAASPAIRKGKSSRLDVPTARCSGSRR